MKLYQLDQDKILEYKVVRDYEKEKEYKKEIITKKENQFYNIVTGNCILAEKIVKGEAIDSGYYNRKNGFDMEMRPSYYYGKEKEEFLLEYLFLKDYINGIENGICLKIENLRPKHFEQNYYLISQRTQVKNRNIEDMYYHFFENSYQMPIELASLTLLEQGKYERFLEDEALLDMIPEQLYQVYPIGEMDACVLNKEIPGVLQMNKVIEAQGKILEKINRIKT